MLLALPIIAQNEVVINLNLKSNTAFTLGGATEDDTLTISWGAINKSTSPLITQRGLHEEEPIIIPINEPRLILIGLKGCVGEYELVAAPGENITVSGRVIKEAQETSITLAGRTIRAEYNKKIPVFFKKMKVKGAYWQAPYEKMCKRYQYHRDSVEAQINHDFALERQAIENAKKTGNEEAIAAMYRTKNGQRYIDRVMGDFEEHGNFFYDLVYNYRNNFLGPLAMLRFGGRLSKNYRFMYELLSDEARQSYYGREVADEVNPPTLIGDIAPTVTVVNTEGENKLLSFTRHGNRYLLLDFWASWCEPCHKEVPNLKRLYELYHEKGLDIIGISADRNVEQWKEALEEMNVKWCNYIDLERQATSEYKVQYIPNSFIMDDKGNVIAEKLRGKELADFIEKLFSTESNINEQK